MFQLFSGPDATPELKHSKFMGLTLDHDGLIVIGEVVKHALKVFSPNQCVTLKMQESVGMKIKIFWLRKVELSML